MKKHKKRNGIHKKIGSSHPKIRDLQPNLGDAGLFGRHYPNLETRLKTIEKIKSLAEATRSSNEWWKLGEYLVFNGLMDEDLELINEGISALTSGASVDPPSLTCILDLAWITIHQGMPALALPSLERLIGEAQSSRDAWALKGHCHIKLNQKENAIKAYEIAVSLPNATEYDRKTLGELQAGIECTSISSKMALLKIHPNDMAGLYYSNLELKKAARFWFKTIIQADPKEMAAINALGVVQYCLNEYDEAEKIFKGWLEENDDDADVLTLLGLIQQKHHKNIDAAIILYDKAVATDNKCKLALVNCAALLQDRGEYHNARPYLERALSFDKKSTYHANALQLYGNNVAIIEEDFEKEASLHYEAHKLAHKLDPNKFAYISSYITAALCAGKIKDAVQMYSKHKYSLSRLANGSILEQLVKTYGNRTRDPFFFLDIADVLRSSLGFAAIKPLLVRAWKLSTNIAVHLKKCDIPNDELKAVEQDFFNQLGVLAGQANAQELAIEVWEHIERKYDTGAILNKAVALSSLGQHDDALKIVNGDIKGLGDRSYTVQGNVRHNAGMPLEAIESYKNAVEYEDAFLLPISNAVNCCDELTRPDLLVPFVRVLERDWIENREAQLSLARAAAMQGAHHKASCLYQSVLLNEGEYLNPDDLFASLKDKTEDLTLLGSADIRHHKRFATSLLLSGNHKELANLRNCVATWSKWHDGDWIVVHAEALRITSDIDSAMSIVKSIVDQVPPLITSALCDLEAGDFKEASKLAKKALEHEDGAENFNHPEGRPDAVARSILSLAALELGEYDKAVKLADEAIKNDAGCPIARTSCASAMILLNQIDEACCTLQEGLDRRPGSPAMTRMLVETLVDFDHFDRAAEVLANQRQLLEQNSASGLGAKLGELIALRKLATYENGVDLSKLGMDWALKLSHTSQSWLKANLEIKSRSLNLPEASMFYLAKVIEKEFGDRIFYPFHDALGDASKYITEEYGDFSRFLSGDYAPSLGGMRRVLRGVSKPKKPDEPKLITELRFFLDSLNTIKKDELLKRATLDKLNSLAHVRNSLAHVGEPDTTKLLNYASFVLNADKPGPLLAAIGFEVEAGNH